jgi:two-component system, NarL family, response regulator NreC
MKKRVMIVEDNEEMQILYNVVFKKEPNLEIIAQEDNAESAIKKIPDLKPDLIILDVSLPGMDGIELTAYICSHFPEIKVLVVTAYESERFFAIAKKAGADNLITKSSAFEVLNEAVRLLGMRS